MTFDYLALIGKLEQEKIDILTKEGQVIAAKLWPPIDRKLDKLYKWYVKDYMEGRVTPIKAFRVIKANRQ